MRGSHSGWVSIALHNTLHRQSPWLFNGLSGGGLGIPAAAATGGSADSSWVWRASHDPLQCRATHLQSVQSFVWKDKPIQTAIPHTNSCRYRILLLIFNTNLFTNTESTNQWFNLLFRVNSAHSIIKQNKNISLLWFTCRLNVVSVLITWNTRLLLIKCNMKFCTVFFKATDRKEIICVRES